MDRFSAGRAAAAFFAAALAVACAEDAAPEAPAATPAEPISPPAAAAEGVRRAARELAREADAGVNSSSDGALRVEGNGALDYPARSELLEFLGTVRAKTEAALPGAFPPGSGPMLVVSAVTNGEAAAGTVAAVRRAAVSRPVPRDGALSVPVRIKIGNPAGEIDARALAARAVEGLLCASVAAAAEFLPPGSAAGRPVPPPRWFASGLARHFDASSRQDGYDSTRANWARARLPPVGNLASADSPFPDADDALAAELVAWWLSFPDRASRWALLRGRLAAGEPWTAQLFFETSLGPGSPLDADRDWDSWLVSRRRRVLTPGTTTRSHVVHALSSLALVPGEGGVPADFPEPSAPVLRLFDPDTQAWAPRAAAVRIETLGRLSAGRGDEFREAAQKLSAALAAVASGRRFGPGAKENASAALAALAGSARK